MTTTSDFIIVGGGTSGLVLANRLSDDPQVSVLVIEAGPNRLQDPKITIPGLATTLYNDPTYDWGFATVPQVRDVFIHQPNDLHVALGRPGLISGLRARSNYTARGSVILEAKFSEAQVLSMY